MEKLFMGKLQAVRNLNEFTKKIKELSFKSDYDEINSMVEERQLYMNKIDDIDEKIKEFTNINNYQETNEIKYIKKGIKKLIAEIIEMDKDIRKSLNDEMKAVNSSLNKTEKPSKFLNFKA